jgi:ubiquinone/menaquinone biosynthesis C-methylase UbiE
MVTSLKKHCATEQRSIEYCVQTYPEALEESKKLLKRITKFFDVDKDSKILEIGAAQGKLCIAFQSLGYSCSGIEPYEPAIEVSKDLAKKYNVSIDIKQGFAEDIPKDSNTVDLVIALSVMEHVKDVNAVFKEVMRILKPQGAFYFLTASSLCPRQDEIRFFPFFSWYPKKIKIKIMYWAVKNRPSLVGYTTTPAVNWFTPWETIRLLKESGFIMVYDRWDILDESSYSFLKKIMLKVIKSSSATKLLADLLVPSCAYLAIKNNQSELL